MIAIATANLVTMPKIISKKKVQLKWSVYPETIDRIRKLGNESHREPGQVIDYLVELAWEKFTTEESNND